MVLPSTRFIGLTGGIGSGKSTIRALVADMGIPTLDLDQVGKDILKTNPDLIHELVGVFGNQIIASNNQIDRKALASAAFKSRVGTEKLNAIIHPAIRSYEESWRMQQSSSLAFIEASVLIESGAYSRMDAIVVVIADMEIRRERTIKRGQHDVSAFEAIIQRQCSDAMRLKIADYIIYNNSTIDQLYEQVISLVSQLNP